MLAAASHEALARIADGAAGDYRAGAVSRDGLWSAVESPATHANARAAAARALARSGTDDERARLRVAADRCADPQVRVVLTAIATGRDEDIDEVDEPAPKKRAAAPSRA
jgi:hypothetical protein